jgi:hypothetical protein
VSLVGAIGDSFVSLGVIPDLANAGVARTTEVGDERFPVGDAA